MILQQKHAQVSKTVSYCEWVKNTRDQMTESKKIKTTKMNDGPLSLFIHYLQGRRIVSGCSTELPGGHA